MDKLPERLKEDAEAFLRLFNKEEHLKEDVIRMRILADIIALKVAQILSEDKRPPEGG